MVHLRLLLLQGRLTCSASLIRNADGAGMRKADIYATRYHSYHVVNLGMSDR